MDSTRQNKIARLIQKELGQMLLLQTKQTHGLIVSVSACRVSADLSVCRVYLSVFPSTQAAEIVNNVNLNATTVRYNLGQRLRHQLRIIPELKFFVDDSLDYLEHIDSLLKQ